MKSPALLIVADRGMIKAFTSNGDRTASVPQLREVIRIDEAHQRYQDMYTDQAGSFAKRGVGHLGNSTAERMHVDTEKQNRIIRMIGERLNAILEAHRPARWGFAAPSEINAAILSQVSATWSALLKVNVPKDLIKEAPMALRSHFGIRPA